MLYLFIYVCLFVLFLVILQKFLLCQIDYNIGLLAPNGNITICHNRVLKSRPKLLFEYSVGSKHGYFLSGSFAPSCTSLKTREQSGFILQLETHFLGNIIVEGVQLFAFAGLNASGSVIIGCWDLHSSKASHHLKLPVCLIYANYIGSIWLPLLCNVIWTGEAHHLCYDNRSKLANISSSYPCFSG